MTSSGLPLGGHSHFLQSRRPWLVSVVLGCIPFASAAIPSPPTPPPPASWSGPQPDYDAATRRDRIGRIVVPVMVDGRGPFSFVLDTGANRTVLTAQLITALGLKLNTGDTVEMNGVTGAAIVPTAYIDRLAVGDITLVQQTFPVANGLSSDIDGILGVDGLADMRVLVNFRQQHVQVRLAGEVPPLRDVKRIPARFRFGRLILVNCRVGHVRAQAVIDTGSQYTLGNESLLEALDLKRDYTTTPSVIDVIGETLARQPGERRAVSEINIGDVRVKRWTVAFGKFYVFKLWNLESTPTLVIGMDLLGELDTLAIDYQHREVQFRALERQ